MSNEKSQYRLLLEQAADCHGLLPELLGLYDEIDRLRAELNKEKWLHDQTTNVKEGIEAAFDVLANFAKRQKSVLEAVDEFFDTRLREIGSLSDEAAHIHSMVKKSLGKS